MRASDTHPDAHVVQIEVLRRLGPDGRLALAVQMSDELEAIQRDAIRGRHPEYTDREVWLAQVRLRLGDTLFSRAWPDAPKLAP